MDVGGITLRNAIAKATDNSLRWGVRQGSKTMQLDLQTALAELDELKANYETLKIRAGHLGTVHIEAGQVDDNDVEDAAMDVTREEWITSFSWSELMEHAHRLAATDYELYREDLLKMEVAQQQPAALVDEAKLLHAVGLGMSDFLFYSLHVPTFTYYITLRSTIDEVVRKNRGDLVSNESNLGGDSMGIHVALTPSQWFLDVLTVFNGADKTGAGVYYPAFVDLEDRAFKTTKDVWEIPETGTKLPVGFTNPRIMVTYALDLPYHLTNFANMFGTMSFVPDKKFGRLFQSAVYTDMQLLIHFAAASSNQIDYADFLKNEIDYQKGPKFLFLVKEIKAVAKILRDSFVGVHFTRGDKGPKLVKRLGADKIENAPVPNAVLTVLRQFIVNNMSDHLRRSAIIGIRGDPSKPPSRDRIKDTPLGQLLNFSTQAVRDFTKLINNLKGVNNVTENNIQMNLAQASDLGVLPIIQSIYAQLMVAANCIAATRHRTTSQPNARILLERVMTVDDRYNTPIYNSSFDVIPGLLFHTILGGFNEKGELNFRKKDYFNKAAYRVVFFNVLGSYLRIVPTFKEKKTALKVPTLSGVISLKDPDLAAGNVPSHGRIDQLIEGVRWIEPLALEQLKASSTHNITDIICSFINLTVTDTTALNYETVWKAFLKAGPGTLLLGPGTPYNIPTLSLSHKDCTDFKGGRFLFWSLPLVYTYTVSYVDLSKKKSTPSETQSILGNYLSTLLKEPTESDWVAPLT